MRRDKSRTQGMKVTGKASTCLGRQGLGADVIHLAQEVGEGRSHRRAGRAALSHEKNQQ